MLNGQKVKVKLGGDYPVVPMDKYTCQITDVNTKEKTFDEVPTPGLNYELTILDNKTMDVNGEIESLRGRKLWTWVSLNLSPRSNLGKLCIAALGKEFTKDELKEIEDNGFQGEDLLDTQIDVMVDKVQGTGKNSDREFNNVKTYAKVGKELKSFDNDKTKEGTVRETKPIEMDDKESDDFIEGLEKDKKE